MERTDGLVDAGWHAHTLDAPGKFLVSAEGFHQPRRARAYLVTDDNVRATVERYATERPALDPLSAETLDTSEEAGEIVADSDPETVLWTALQNAPEDGLSIPELMQLTGMSVARRSA